MSYLARLREKSIHPSSQELTKPTKAPFDSFVSAEPGGVQEFFGISIAELEEIAGAEWPEVRDDPQQLEEFAHIVMVRRIRERGEVPAQYTKRVTCKHCGPVWCEPGWSEWVPACLWCFNRIAGRPVPRRAT